MTDENTESTDTGDTELHPEALQVGQQAYQQVVQAADAEAAREGYADRDEFFRARQDRAQAYADAEAQLKSGVTMLSEQRRLLEEVPALGDATTKQQFIQQLKDAEGLSDAEIAKLSRADIKDRWHRHQSGQGGRRRTIPKVRKGNGQRTTQSDREPHGLHEYSSLLYPEERQSELPRTSTPSSTAVEILYGGG